MSEPDWNPASAVNSGSESPPPSGSETAQDLTQGQNPAAQTRASGVSSFPPVNYGGWGQRLDQGQGQAAGRKKIDDDVSPAQREAEDDEGPEDDNGGTAGSDHDDGQGDEPLANNGSWASRLLTMAGVVAQGAWVAARQAVVMARLYPRASMAAGLSVAILGAVMLLKPGKGKNDTTVEITAGRAPKTTSAEAPKSPTTEDPSPKLPTTQIAKTDHAAPAAKSSSSPNADHPAPGSSKLADKNTMADKKADKKAGTLARTELPDLPVASDTPADKGHASSPGNDPGLLVGAKVEPEPAPTSAPALDASDIARSPLSGSGPAELKSGAGLVMLPPVGESPDPAVEKNGPGHVADLAPAPVLAPVMELAAADAKPGTPPEPAQAPASTPVPASVPGSMPPVESPPVVVPPAPATVPAPATARAPLPPVGSMNTTIAQGGDLTVKEANDAAGHVAIGTTGIAGGAAAGIRAALGAVTALGAGGHDQPKPNDKQKQTTSREAPPAPAPAPAQSPLPEQVQESPPTPPPVKAGDREPAHIAVPVPVVAEPPPSRPTENSGPGSDPSAGGSGNDGRQGKPGGDIEPKDRPRSASTSPVEHATTASSEELERQGWVPIKHTGGEAVRDVQRDVPGLDDDAAPGTAAGTTDPSAHADKEQSFEVESPPGTRNSSSGQRAGMGTRTAAAAGESKLETVLHKVEGRENFWDISRMYYSNGRYYKALWKANEDKVPVMDQIHRGTVIRIPPPEDLDPAYIDPPGKRLVQSQSRTDGEILARHEREADADDSASSRSDQALRNRRASNPANDGVPIRRSSRSDLELNLPVSDAATEQASGRDRSTGRERGGSTAVARPIYKVRQYDTLRTIARDTLDDSRRANEILELNRDIIDDPTHLIVGQLLELPEDAHPARSRSRR